MHKGFAGILEIAEELNEIDIDKMKIFLEQKFGDKGELIDIQTDFTNLSTPYLTFDIAYNIEILINNRISEITDLTEEDIDAIEYMDDDDERIIQYEIAKNFAYCELVLIKTKNKPLSHILIDTAIAKKIKSNIKKMAMQLSSLNEDDVDAIDYLDDDKRKIQWKIAKEIAKAIIIYYLSGNISRVQYYQLNNKPMFIIPKPFFSGSISEQYAISDECIIKKHILKITSLIEEDINYIKNQTDDNGLAKLYYVAKKILRYQLTISLIDKNKTKKTTTLKKQPDKVTIDSNTLCNNPNYLLVTERQGVSVYLDLSSVTIHLCAPPIYEISGNYYSIKCGNILGYFSHENYIRYDEETLTTWSKDNGKWKFLDVTGDFMVSLGNKSAANDLFNAAYGRNFYQ